jgi:TM2 domain-containing membrane protein YozV
MINLLKSTIFNASFWYGAVIFTLGVVGYLYSTGSNLVWKIKQKEKTKK